MDQMIKFVGGILNGVSLPLPTPAPHVIFVYRTEKGWSIEWGFPAATSAEHKYYLRTKENEYHTNQAPGVSKPS